MDMYFILLFAIYIVIVFVVALISKKIGYKLPLILGLLAVLVSFYFKFTQPKPMIIFTEPVGNALHQMGLYLGLIFVVSFFLIAFLTYRGKR